ncbi:hypothetical protein N7495_003827 [Penicillium taxi]|uniref:uncharacterized protein n=1 Tax=Penicillium taxi TaxID=168475 RepID=UPI0025451702|nr:uncharacterized protein N7495_003827 [Penicillium taxi]KAJ5899083.1 hypothetical protein N7495_003827 [Penicillium taxi]
MRSIHFYKWLVAWLDAEAEQEAPQAPTVPAPRDNRPDLPVNVPAGPIFADEFSDESDWADDGSDTTSLSSSLLYYEYENGRRYHSNRTDFGNRMPNDEAEQDRMDLAHHIWRLLLDGELYKAPIENPQKILDLGTGTGIWALDIAEQFPDAYVEGTDISPIQTVWPWPNLKFICENFEEEWLHDRDFDFIHARLIAGCVSDWPQLFRQAYDHLKPGGYFEIQESAVWAWSDDGTLPPDSPLIQYLSVLDLASQQTGRELNIYFKLKDWLIDAGFEDVTQHTYFLPYGPWPKDPQLKEIGKYQALMVQDAVESYGLRYCTEVLNWGVEPCRIFQAMVKQQLRDRNQHSYVKE